MKRMPAEFLWSGEARRLYSEWEAEEVRFSIREMGGALHDAIRDVSRLAAGVKSVLLVGAGPNPAAETAALLSAGCPSSVFVHDICGQNEVCSLLGNCLGSDVTLTPVHGFDLTVAGSAVQHVPQHVDLATWLGSGAGNLSDTDLDVALVNLRAISKSLLIDVPVASVLSDPRYQHDYRMSPGESAWLSAAFAAYKRDLGREWKGSCRSVGPCSRCLKVGLEIGERGYVQTVHSDQVEIIRFQRRPVWSWLESFGASGWQLSARDVIGGRVPRLVALLGRRT